MGKTDGAGKCRGTIEFATRSPALNDLSFSSLSLLLSLRANPCSLTFSILPRFSLPTCPRSPPPSLATLLRLSHSHSRWQREHYVQLQGAFSRSNSGWRSFDHDPEERLGSIRMRSFSLLPPVPPQIRFRAVGAREAFDSAFFLY